MDISGAVGGALGGVGKGAGQALSIAGTFIPALLIGIVLAAIIWFTFLEDMIFFKHRVKLKKIVGSGYKWIEDKAMEKRLKNGAKIWRLKKLKINTSIPPDEILIMGAGGRLVAEGYLTNDNTIIWAKDNFDMKKINLEVKKVLKKVEEKQELNEEEKNLLKFDANFQPVTTNDRVVIFDAMKAAEFGKKDLAHLIEKALPYAFMVIMLIIVIFGFKYYAGPLNEYGIQLLAASAPIAEQNRITAEYMYAMKNDLTVMRADLDFLKEKNVLGGKFINASIG